MITTTTTNGTKTTANHSRQIGACGIAIAATLLGSVLAPLAARADGAGTCVSQNGMSVMFDAETSEAEAYDMAAGQGGTIAFAPDGGSWSYTATDGSVQPGQPITLTYSFVPDGTSILSTYADADTVSNLFATMDAQFPGGRVAWKQQFADAFAAWGEHTNITYLEVSDDGAPITGGAIGSLGARGDVRIGMHEIGPGPLAYNFYPVFGGDMVLDSLDMATFTNPASGFRALRNVIMHEHGHGMGLAHVLPGNGTKLMEPNLATAFDGPQEDDVRGAQFLYGDRDESNDFAEDAILIGDTLRDPATAGAQSFTVEGVALERADSTDWYAFTAFAAAPITVRVAPTGSTYEFGREDEAPQLIDAKAARDLKFRIWRRVSAQTGEISILAQIDFNGAGEAEYHPPVPYTLAGYILVEIYSEDGVDDIQGYTLTVSNSAIETPVEPPAMFVTDGLDLITTNSTLRFDETTVGQTSGKALTISNAGDGPLRFEGQPKFTVAGPAAGDFLVQLAASEIAPDGFAVLGIGFVPTRTGERIAVLSIPNNDPLQPDFSFIIRGTGLQAPEAVLAVEWETLLINADDELAFGDVKIGETLETALTLRNLGEAPLNVTDLQIAGEAAGDYTLDLATTTIAPGGERSGTLSVTPSATGARDATITILSNASESTFPLTLLTDAFVEIVDCNGNGIEDADDVAGGNGDCDLNGVPDECDIDTDGDAVIDACDNCPAVANAGQFDTNADGTGDACEPVVDEPIDDENPDVDPDDTETEPEEIDVVDDQIDNGEDTDDVIEEQPVDDNVDDELELDNGTAGPVGGFCGAGAVGMIPAMMFGLCGMRPRRRGPAEA